MTILLVVLGILVILAVMLDMLVTTLSVGGAGPLTGRVAGTLWWIVLRVHRWRSNHQLLTTAGWLILLTLVVFWLFFTWFGWTILFAASDNAVIISSSKAPASLLERIYFTGFTISTLGLGDYEPQGNFWQIATAIASANGFILVTVGAAYLLPVVSAAANKRKIAVYISALGGTGDDIVARAWNGKDFGQLSQHLINLAPLLSGLGEMHLTYPILHYFHNLERARTMALSLAALDEALTLLKYGVKESCRLDLATINTARRCTSAFLKTLRSAYLEPAPHIPPSPSLESLRAIGIPTVSNQEFEKAIKNLTQRRQLLLAMVQNDGWTWDAIASRQSTNRTSSLDDETSVKEAVLY